MLLLVQTNFYLAFNSGGSVEELKLNKTEQQPVNSALKGISGEWKASKIVMRFKKRGHKSQMQLSIDS